MAKKQTLYQILRKSGLFSNKEELVSALREGKVTVDEKVTKNQEFQCGKNRVVAVDGEEVSFVAKKYFILNKPFNTSCQNGDQFKYVRDIIDKETVGDKVWNSLFCVGRLDVPTTGLLIITNDGELSKRILSPESKVFKKYKVLLKQPIVQAQVKKLGSGLDIELKNGESFQTSPAQVEEINDHEVYISISEGKFRQVRKMFEAVGNKVVSLHRVAIGNLGLGDLGLGDFEEISYQELIEKTFNSSL